MVNELVCTKLPAQHPPQHKASTVTRPLRIGTSPPVSQEENESCSRVSCGPHVAGDPGLAGDLPPPRVSFMEDASASPGKEFK